MAMIPVSNRVTVVLVLLVCLWLGACAGRLEASGEGAGWDGAKTPQERIDAIIEMLERESLEDSLEKLYRVDEFYSPGSMSCSFMPPPFSDVRKILSNRRFAKIYEELKALDSDARCAHLNAYLTKHVGQSQRWVESWKLENMGPRPRIYQIGNLTEVAGEPPTHEGTRLAVQSLALLSGLLGEARMLPRIRALAEHPVTGAEFVEGDYEDHVVTTLTRDRLLMPDNIAAQAVFLMARNADPAAAAAYGLDVGRVLGIVDDAEAQLEEEFNASPPGWQAEMMYRWKAAIKTIRLSNYRSRVTEYDPKGGGPIDNSHGYFDIMFLITPEWELVGKVKECLAALTGT